MPTLALSVNVSREHASASEGMPPEIELFEDHNIR